MMKATGFNLKTRKGSVVEGHLHLNGITISLNEKDHTEWIRDGHHEGRWQITVGDPAGKLPSGLVSGYTWVTYTTDSDGWRWASVHLASKSDKVIGIGPGGWEANDGCWHKLCFRALLKVVAEELAGLLESRKAA